MKRLLPTFGLLALGAAVAVISMGPTTPETTSPYRWTVGTTDPFQVTWTTSATATLPVEGSQPFDIKSHLRGRFDVTTLSITEEGGVVQRARLTELDDLRVQVGGEDVELEHSSMLGVFVDLHRDADGTLTDLRVAPAAPVAARNTLMGLAKSFAVPAPTAKHRRTSFGEAIDVWTGEHRTTDTFVQLSGAPATARIEGSGNATVQWTDGHLETFEGTDHARAVSDGVVWLDTHDVASWTHLGTVAARTHATSFPLPAPIQAPEPGTPDGPHLMGRIQGFVPGEDAGPILWSGTQVLAVDADARRLVGQLAQSPHTSHAHRELALDLLAHTPGGHGEEELLGALHMLTDHHHFDAYLQRTAFLPHASGAVTDALHQWMELEGDIGRAAAVALGAVGPRTADPDAALFPLRTPLPADPNDAASHIAGLGNAHLDRDLPRLRDASFDPRPRVRAAAIHAVRHYDDAVVMESVTVALNDPHPGVQRAALSLVTSRTPTALVLDTLANLALDDTVAAENFGVFTSAVAPHTAHPRITAGLQKVLERPGADPVLRSRIRSLLRG